MTQGLIGRAGPTRRDLLGTGAAVAALLAVSGRRARAEDVTTITWWDIYQPLIPLHQKMWESYARTHPAKVAYTGMNPSDMMQALQLAVRSNQSPDVFNVPTGGAATLASLHAAKWFAPLDPSFVFDKPFQTETLAEGFTRFDGKQYSFPLFSFRWHSTSAWFDTAAVAPGAIDDASGSWETMRAVAASATRNGKYGLLLPLQFASRMSDHLSDLAMAAGAAGPINWKTGEYAYSSAEYVAALEFLLSFQKDRTLHPASSSVDARQGRARWAAGEAAFFFDGPWNSGVLTNSFGAFLPRVAAIDVPAPRGTTGKSVQHAPATGTFFISSQSKHAKQASDVLQLMTTEDYYIALAERMDQPPLDLSAVEKAKVHATYKKVVADFRTVVKLAPDPLIRNPAVAKVYGEMRDVTPGLGEIIQGAFSGSFDNPKPVLQQLDDQMNAERDRAIKVARQAGGQVSADDWVFADWKKGVDYIAGRG
jgi:multiple sugar transport system substrate-binding protein